MSSMPLETNMVGILPAALTGSIEEPLITEDGIAPTSIIRTDSAWHIQLDWSLEGSLVSWIPFLDQSWVVRAFLESIGPGTEYNLPEDFSVAAPTLNLNAGTPDATVPNKLNYSLTIDVDPAAATPQRVDAGIYKLVVAVTSVHNSSGTPGSFAGFFEGKTLQFYDA
jgi:hypothetical protein